MINTTIKQTMNKEQIIDEVYENYENAYYKGQAFGYKKLNDNEFSPDLKILKESFIDKCKTDSDFSETWGLKIEERELSLEERYKLANINGRKERIPGEPYYTDEQQHSLLDELAPTKIITLTYNNETIKNYEQRTDY